MGISQEQIIFMIIFFPLFLISLGCHEYAHAYAAYRAGDDTAKQLGRMTLNPMAHIDPIGLLFFVMSSVAGVGFGWAKPVPVTPRLFRNYYRDEVIVSIAGVGTNFMLVILGTLVLKALFMLGVLSQYSSSIGSHYLLKIMVGFIQLNTVLIVFNLIPIPPLDGSHVLRVLLPTKYLPTFDRIAQYGFLILMLLLFSGLLRGVFGFVLTVVMAGVSAFIGL